MKFRLINPQNSFHLKVATYFPVPCKSKRLNFIIKSNILAPIRAGQKKFWLVKHEQNQSWDCPIHCSSEKQQSLFLMLMSIRHAADMSDVNAPFCCGLQFCIKSWKYSIKQIVRYVFVLDLHAHILVPCFLKVSGQKNRDISDQRRFCRWAFALFA